MTSKIRISTLQESIHIARDVSIEVRKDENSEWIDISSVVRDVDIKLHVGSLVEAKLTVYPSAIVVEGESLTTLFLDEKLGIDNVGTSTG